MSILTKLEDMINPEVMADMISAKVENRIAALPYAKVDTTLEGSEGNTITIPRFEHIGDAVEVGEGEDIPMESMKTQSVQYTIKKVGKGITLSDEAVLSGHGNIVGEATAQLGDSIFQKTDNDVIDELYKAIYTYASDKVISYEQIVNTIDLFNEERNSKKVMFVHPKQVTTLRKDPNFISADKYQEGSVVVSGEIGKICNTSVIPSRKVVFVDGYFYNPIVKIDEDTETEETSPAITIYVKRETNVETERKAKNRTTEITADKLYITALTNESKVVIGKYLGESTELTVTPDTVTVAKGKTSSALTITTEASDFTMVSEDTATATVNKTAKTITGVKAGTTEVEITAQATGKTLTSKKIAVTVTE